MAMIGVSVSPGTLVAGQPSALAIELSNAGPGACSDVIFRLKLPPGMALVSGRDRIEVDEIPPGQAHVHPVTVLPGRPGDVEVGTSNFSYRDEHGVKRRQDDWRAPLRVLAASPAQGPARASVPGPSRPLPRLTLSHGGGKLALDEWDVLEVLIRNATGVPFHDVTLTLNGPFRVDRASARIQLLRDGETGRAAISVHIPDRGKVPVSIHTTYRYQDERGQLSPGEQNDRLTVEVAAPAETVPPQPGEKAPVTTILYLVAQPRNTDPLRSYQEMREVESLLQLGRDRERYRLEHCVAARLRDISQALGDYWPQIVHFAGHGREDGSLVVENDLGRASYVNPAGLANLLGGFAASVQCVIVNACHSLTLAEAMSEQIDYVVGMRSEILDFASIQFSVGFYQGLFAGKTVPDAFRQGQGLVQAEPVTNSEYRVPILLERRST